MTEFTIFIYLLSIILYLSAAITALFFLIPLQFKEMLIKNGLIPLRIQMLRKGVLSFIVAMSGVVALTTRFYIDGELSRIIALIFVLVNSLGIFLIVLIGARIYRYHYSDESIEYHNEMDKLERSKK